MIESIFFLHLLLKTFGTFGRTVLFRCRIRKRHNKGLFQRFFEPHTMFVRLRYNQPHTRENVFHWFPVRSTVRNQLDPTLYLKDLLFKHCVHYRAITLKLLLNLVKIGCIILLDFQRLDTLFRARWSLHLMY